MSTLRPVSLTYVEETRFGFWFLQSHVWQHHVLRVAINDLVLGDASVNLRLRRRGQHTEVAVVSRRGDVAIRIAQ